MWRAIFKMSLAVGWGLWLAAMGWFAFGMGIFTDLLLDAPLGLNALSFVIVTFITRFLIRERRILTFGNLWTIATLVIIAHLAFMWVTQTMGGIHFSIARHWQPLMTSILTWPVVYYCLAKWRI